ncbi:hypothetical protein Desku_1129 [Desulfofundulus kuznetsovii DSM 6115]|uniref:Uncharacterized protein n=1 Tax=Desulfofundulus kuznetsovii (strain DSM 6115 / VKM B-1805 / 17) TaxID=760568 RepID=A0AAU8P8T1_DESK7|nr:hypothetical protein Desku_1129 [Desulfofundulus kuznetsovii DSM 6115]
MLKPNIAESIDRIEKQIKQLASTLDEYEACWRRNEQLATIERFLEQARLAGFDPTLIAELRLFARVLADDEQSDMTLAEEEEQRRQKAQSLSWSGYDVIETRSR